MANHNLYIGEIQWINEKFNETTSYLLIAAEKWSEAAEFVVNDYGEDNIISMELFQIGLSNESLEISKSLYELFKYDLPEVAKCPPTEFRTNLIAKEKEIEYNGYHIND